MIGRCASGVEGCRLVPLNCRIWLSGSNVVGRPTKTLVSAEVTSIRNAKGGKALPGKGWAIRDTLDAGRRMRLVLNAEASTGHRPRGVHGVETSGIRRGLRADPMGVQRRSCGCGEPQTSLRLVGGCSALPEHEEGCFLEARLQTSRGAWEYRVRLARRIRLRTVTCHNENRLREEMIDGCGQVGRTRSRGRGPLWFRSSDRTAGPASGLQAQKEGVWKAEIVGGAC